MALDFRLLICLVGSFAFVVLYNAMILIELPIFFVSYSAIMVFWVAGSYVALKGTLSRCFYLVGLSLCLPMISHPVGYLPDFFISFMEPFEASGASSSRGLSIDRIQIRSFIVSVVGFILLAEVMWPLGKRDLKEFFKAIAFMTILVAVVLVHSYDGYSVGQVFLDLGCFAGALAMRCFVRIENLNRVFEERCWTSLSTIFTVLALIMAVDILLSLSGVISWSTSYRDGLQGVFYAFETPFAWVLGSCMVFNLARLDRLNVLFWILLGLGCLLLFMTNIKTAVIAACGTMLTSHLKKRLVGWRRPSCRSGIPSLL